MPSLWIRLREAAKRQHPIVLDTDDDRICEKVWAAVLEDPEISFFELPEPRRVLPELEYRNIEDITLADVHSAGNITGKRKKPEDADNEESDIGALGDTVATQAGAYILYTFKQVKQVSSPCNHALLLTMVERGVS